LPRWERKGKEKGNRKENANIGLERRKNGESCCAPTGLGLFRPGKHRNVNVAPGQH
jgi:hypothetical protein